MKYSKDQDLAVKNIVLAFADPTMLQTLEYLLQEVNGYHIAGRFQTGRSALHFLDAKKDQAGLLLLGCYLQDMDTVRFLRLLRQQAGGHQRVILCGPARYIQFMDNGLLSNSVDYYMIEPYDPNDLLAAIRMLDGPGRLCKTTQWDDAIREQLDALGIADTLEGYWYLLGCLQEWLQLSGQESVPQMKSVLLSVARMRKVDVKAVESGIQRVLSQLKKAEKIPQECYKMKPFLAWLADRVQVRSTQEGLGERYAGEFGTATV